VTFKKKIRGPDFFGVAEPRGVAPVSEARGAKASLIEKGRKSTQLLVAQPCGYWEVNPLLFTHLQSNLSIAWLIGDNRKKKVISAGRISWMCGSAAKNPLFESCIRFTDRSFGRICRTKLEGLKACVDILSP
jgi:hypothetical protein